MFMARFLLLVSLVAFGQTTLVAQDSPLPSRGSFIEDRAAKKLLEAGDARLEADETRKAVEIWQSVIERYPRSKVRFEAHMRLGDYFLNRERAYDRARAQFQAAADEENRDTEARAQALVQTGICFYEVRNYGKCFAIMRDVIEQFPVSSEVNRAYYYIGLGHFQLGHYSRAIDSLEKVGTALTEDDSRREKAEAGKRLFIKIDDADLAALEPGQSIEVLCETSGGDSEKVRCFQLGRNVRVMLGNISTQLGPPQKYNDALEVNGEDSITISYIDEHTADREFNRPVSRTIPIVANAIVQMTDGAFRETLQGVVLGKPVNVQITDFDQDKGPNAETVTAIAKVYRRKTEEELIDEVASQAGASASDAVANSETAFEPDPYKMIDSVKLTLTESKTVQLAESLQDEDSVPDETPNESDQGVYSGVFRATVPLVKAETVVNGDDTLQALTGDMIRITYLDEQNTSAGANSVQGSAKCVDGNLGGVRVTRSVISDEELRIRTRLRTADALTNIGNRYKEFGLQKQANAKYQQALEVCEDVTRDAVKLGGALLEQTYVQLWEIYYEMDNLNLAAAMATRLQREFPNSGFVDDALLQLADVARTQGNINRAIGIYNRLVGMQSSDLRGEAQFGVAACYEQLAEDATDARQSQLLDRAFQEYKKVFDQFPESGRVGEAVSKMANHYYQQQDYARAIDTFETVLTDYPDAKFLDVILFNYGRCLYRMNRRADARRRFDQLISEFPESPLATDAKKISDALARAGV